MSEVLMFMLFLPPSHNIKKLDKADKQLVKECQDVLCVIAIHVSQDMKYEVVKLDFLCI